MKHGRRYAAVSLGLTVLLALLTPLPSPTEGNDAPARPRLVVLVFFDQLRGDYLGRWDELFGDAGFRRLEKEGAWFQNCHYPYAGTWTAAGHSSVATGAFPCKHGVIANEWYDRASGLSVGCVSSDRYDVVPPRPRDATKGANKKSRGVAPDRLLSPTLADALKEATAGRGRVVSLSIKDRSAVLPGGRRPDACYWLDGSTGLFVTSTYYRDRLHPWVAEYNRGRPADRWLDRKWERLRSDLDYARCSGPDDVVGEGIGYLQGRTFPHALGGAQALLKSTYYGALTNSPFGNELLLGLARQAIQAEGLGTRATPDLLCLSFSSNDPVGHCWGPDSQEVLDVTLRSDLIVKGLLAVLDTRVGKGRYTLALTADHGVCPLPEVSRGRGQEAARISPTLLRKRAAEHLSRLFPGNTGEPSWVQAISDNEVYLNQAALRRHGLKQADVEEALARWLEKQPGLQAAYTRTHLLAGTATGDALGQSVRRSFYPGRSGDVMVITKPYHLLTSYLTGTNHGTPHPYDTHVPLLVYGPGVRSGVRREAVTPLAAAVILARALGIEPPADAQASLPEGLFRSAAQPPGKTGYPTSPTSPSW